ncbi:MAG: GH3 auxin-responsive promoter family protein [Flavobacteriales bacterium]|nr:GH3 auxin-responsive promoter family protein [Bacteroidota bacterium]MCB9239529.1 GH3 auxin-responsive promoter family protein [Flavobacteriales bacterium]
MSVLSFIAKRYARSIRKTADRTSARGVELQQETFRKLMKSVAQTAFGKEHGLSENTTVTEFQQRVPVRDYEGLKSYFDRIASGEAHVCWPGKPAYLAKTSGTTSGAKYIPITKDSIPNHINSARNALLEYIHTSGKADFLTGKLIFLSGSPTLTEKNGILTGRLSGIVNHHVPAYLRRNQMPSWETNCIEDWETKVNKIASETISENMTLISGIPPWMQMYFDILQDKKNGQTISEIFPNLQVLVYGGVNFAPYREKLFNSVGRRIDTVELFPASEGFFAYQSDPNDPGMRLLVNEGIFYEFIPMASIHDPHPTRLTLAEVEVDVNYALVLSSNAGLWGYSIGDTIKFTSLNPFKVVVTGRVKHFISAFGEHVIAEEVEYALMTTAADHRVAITEFTVAPQVNPSEGELPHHEWFIEFEEVPNNLEGFAAEVDERLQQKNVYYKDLIEGKILRPLKITPVTKGGFIQYMKSQGKLGGQNKVPRLSNDRKIADQLR